MTTTTLAEQTYLPGEDDVAEIYEFLAAHEASQGVADSPVYYLSGPASGDRVEVPREIHDVLLHVVEALKAGKAVTVARLATRLTTQQAADVLMISRPTLVKLLEDGLIAHERVSTRRTVMLADVLAYRESRRAAQIAALEATSLPFDDEDDPEKVAALLAEARAAAGRAHTPRS